MMRRTSFVCSVLLLASCARWAQEPRFGSLSRDHRPFGFKHNIELIEVSNGLRIALIRDDRTNLATIDLRYAVGAAEDPSGRSGLAHLVEHLVFELRGKPGGPTLGEELGELALYSNASTSWDFTHYTTHVPIENLSKAIALEARRMRAPCDQLDEATFLREREVVRAEGRERSSPSVDAMRDILGEVYGKDHPYTRPITSDDVATVTRDEACAFIERHYTPDRAYLVVTGPFDAAETKALIGRSFGPIIRKAPGPRAAVPAPRLDGKTTRRTASVAKPTALVFLSHPTWGADGAVKYILGRQALAAALSSADDDNGWITNTSVYIEGGWRAPVLVAAVEVNDAARLEEAASEVFLQAGQLLDGTSSRTLSPVLGEMTMAYVESWDDLPNRGSWIADFMQYTKHNWFMLQELRAITDTDWSSAIMQLRGAMSATRSHVVLVTPGSGVSAARAAAVPSGSHNLTPWRAPVDPADADKPIEITGVPAAIKVEEYSLANGLTVQLAPDPNSPIIDARLVFPVGSAHEPSDRPYLAVAAAKLLSNDVEGYYDAPTFEKLEWSMSHDTQYWADVSETATTFTTRGLAQWGDWHVWYLSWLLDQGRYNAVMIDALHDLGRARGDDADEEYDPVAKVFLERLFGKGHPYAVPEPKRGAAYLNIDAEDLDGWRERYFRARGATLVVSGAFDVEAMKREIDELFGPWAGTAPAALPDIPPVRPAKGPTWLAVDRERAAQTTIFVGFATKSHPGRDEAARAVVAEMVEDALRDVREGMGASYGLHARYETRAAGSVLGLVGEVDESKADAVLVKVMASLEALRAGGDDQRAAFVRARKKVLSQALGRAGGASAVANELAANAAAGHSLRHGSIVATQLSALRFDEVARVAAADLAPERRVVLISGKRASVDAAFAAVSVTPERPLPPVESEDTDDRVDKAVTAPKPRPKPRAAIKPHRPDDGPKLSVGAPDGLIAPTRGGLFLGDTKISLDEFLAIAGEEDIRSDMRTRKWAKRGLIGGGVASIVAGVVVAFTGPACNRETMSFDDYEECIGAKSARKNGAAGLVGVGLVLGALSVQISAGAPSEQQLRRFAARYNRVVVSPEVTDHGAGLAISGDF